MSEAEIGIVVLTLKVAFVAILLALPLAVFTSYLILFTRFRFGKSLLSLSLFPLILPPVVTGYFLLVIFGRNHAFGEFLTSMGLSPLFHWTGAAIASGVMAYPLVLRAVYVAMESIDRTLLKSARGLGANRWQLFTKVILPLSKNGVLAGVVLGFAKAMGEFGATITFVANIPGQTQTLSGAIYNELQIPGQESAAWRLIIVSIIISLLAVYLSERLARRAIFR